MRISPSRMYISPKAPSPVSLCPRPPLSAARAQPERQRGGTLVRGIGRGRGGGGGRRLPAVPRGRRGGRRPAGNGLDRLHLQAAHPAETLHGGVRRRGRRRPAGAADRRGDRAGGVAGRPGGGAGACAYRRRR